MPFPFEAAVLPRMRSLVTSRSNRAKEGSMLSVVRRQPTLICRLSFDQCDHAATGNARRLDRVAFGPDQKLIRPECVNPI